MGKIRLGIVNPETWNFFHGLFRFFCANYRTSVFTARKSPLPFYRSRIEKHLLKRDLNRFLRDNDVVFFEWASDMLALATSMPKSTGIVTRLHRWELYKWSHLINWDPVDRIILVSEAKRKEFLHRFPQQGGKVQVIPEFIDVGRFHFNDRDFAGSIGILCHLGPRKRVYDLILAFSELVKQNPSLRLHVGGDAHPGHPDYYSALMGLVKRLSMDEVVRFDGYVQVPAEWYQKIDIFVSHSYSEGLQVSPIEAMASGCYTLAHRWDGADELLPDDCLYFTDRELLDKIAGFCALPDEAKRQERARMRRIAAEKFDIELNKGKIGRIVDELARDASHS